MKKNDLLNVAPLLLALALLWGCEPKDPGSPGGNQPPETRIVVAPMEGDTADHYVSPSPMFHVQWLGHDADGVVEGYWVWVDDEPEKWSTGGDSAWAFESAITDPDNPDRTLQRHTVRVAAVDNEGARDPTPAERTIDVFNYPPRITGFESNFQDSDTVGAGIDFSIEWSDANISGVEFRLWVDDQPVMLEVMVRGQLTPKEWTPLSRFQFCDTSDPAILDAIDPGVQPVDISLLPPGPRALKVEVRDLGNAIGEPVHRQIVVSDMVRPSMSAITAIYGTADYYPDGSIFYQPRTTTSMTMTGAADDYSGTIHSYRYRDRSGLIGDTTWTDWGPGSAEFNDLPVGQYQFQAQCRDFAGFYSDTLDHLMSIVEAEFSGQTILVIDETLDGNGNPGSPDDPQCDDFYAAILSGLVGEGWTVETLDYATHAVGIESYVSALDVFDKRIIIWHADDKRAYELAANQGLLSQYLNRGGRLILSGWDVLGAFTLTDEITFSSGFAYTYLGIEGGKRATQKVFVGMTGVPEYNYPDLNLDHDKIPGRWDGLDKCWALYPRRRVDTIGEWVDFEGPGAEMHEESNCIRNFSPIIAWRTIVLGFPLYFMQNDEARLFIERAVEDISR